METEKKTIGRKRGPAPPAGGYSLIARSSQAMTKRHIRRYLIDIREALIADLGPREEDLSPAQRIVVDRIVTLLGGIRAIEEAMRSKGVLSDNGLIRPEFTQGYLAWNNTLQRWMTTLGVKAKTRDALLSPAMLATIVKAESKGPEGDGKAVDGVVNGDPAGDDGETEKAPENASCDDSDDGGGDDGQD